jgi:hypothetical protein
MDLIPQELAALIPDNLIRTETVLTRYPIHRLAKKGTIDIEIRNKETAFKWEVSYNSKYGQPGPLAYKVDTLVINRKIDEAERPLPLVIKLGSLRDIAKETGTGEAHTSSVKKAIMQNVGALITAKIAYKGHDGSEHTEEFSNTRYGIAFIGDKLPDGRTADAVYLVLNDWYRKILDTAQTRPLDYDYLKKLSPGAQRLYELISFQIYGALESERRRAKLLYSDICTRAPQTRYFDFEHVKKQMYKLHAPHKKSGYISAVHFQEIINSDGQIDWEMFYTPGLKAKGEHVGAKRKPKRKKEKQRELPIKIELQAAEAATTSTEELNDEERVFITKLSGYGFSETEAGKLVRARLEACRLKIPAIPYLPEGQGKKNQAGNIRAFIERDDWQLPQGYLDAQAKGASAKKATARKEAIDRCPMCDSNGHRFIQSEKYPRGAMKPCTHDPAVEKQYPGAIS